MIEGIPLPATDEPGDAAFWAAALRGELVVQRCGACGARRFPPRPMCPHCQSTESEWAPVSGRGRVWSFAVPHPPLLPAFTNLAPYVVAVIELDDDPSIRMVGNLVVRPDGAINEIVPAAVSIGMPVRVVFERLADDVALPRWMPA